MKLKKLSILLVIVTAAYSLCSCSSFVASVENLVDPTKIYVEDNEDYSFKTIDKQSYEFPDLYTYAESSYGYDALSDKDRKIYEMLEKNSYSVANKADKNGRYCVSKIVTDDSVSDVEFLQVLTAYLMDNPQQFWLNDYSTYININDRRVFQCYSYISADEVKEKQDEFYGRIKQIVNEAPYGLSTDFDKEVYIHNYILDSCVYEDGDSWENNSTYGAVINGKTVCTGYSQEMQLLLSCFGVQSTIVTGDGDGQGHQWNLVCVDGSWYHLDPTWDDTDKSGYSEREIDYARYDYFNLTTEQISQDHTVARLYGEMTEDEISAGEESKYAALFNLFLPDCSSTDYNYYYYTSVKINDLSGNIDNKTASEFAQKINDKATIIPIYISSDESIEKSLDKVFFGEPYLFFKYMDYINNTGLSDIALPDEGVSVFMDEHIEKLAFVDMEFIRQQ